MAHEDQLSQRMRKLLMEINIFPRKTERTRILEESLYSIAAMLNLEIVVKDDANE